MKRRFIQNITHKWCLMRCIVDTYLWTKSPGRYNSEFCVDQNLFQALQEIHKDTHAIPALRFPHPWGVELGERGLNTNVHILTLK